MDFFDKLKTKAFKTRQIAQIAIKNFESLKKEVTSENIYDVLQEWINLNHEGGLNPRSIKQYFNPIRSYLYHKGFKLHPQDIKENLNFPKIIEEEKYPLKLDEILLILDAVPYRKKALYLTLISSGMRIGEACKITKKDIDLSLKRPMIKIPAKITKTRRGRTTFISSEAWRFLQPIYTKTDQNETLFGASAESEETIFARYCDKIGFNARYDSKIRKITLHSFRAYFITKISRYDANIAKLLSGQRGYLLQYDRLTDEEKLESYLEFEKELLVYDNTKLKQDLAKAKSEKITLESMMEKLKEVDEIKQKVQELLDQKANIAQQSNNQ